MLNNEKTSVDGLQIIGVHDSEAARPAELRSILHRVQIDPMHSSILLAHRPVNLSIAEEAGVSLQLSGHTHGGQIWPWNLMVSRIYGRFGHGLGRLGKLQVLYQLRRRHMGTSLASGDQTRNCAASFGKRDGPRLTMDDLVSTLLCLPFSHSPGGCLDGDHLKQDQDFRGDEGDVACTPRLHHGGISLIDWMRF